MTAHPDSPENIVQGNFTDPTGVPTPKDNTLMRESSYPSRTSEPVQQGKDFVPE